LYGDIFQNKEAGADLLKESGHGEKTGKGMCGKA